MQIRTPLLAIAAIAALLNGCATENSDSQSEQSIQDTRPSRLFLQQISNNSAIVKWRGAASQACLATDATGLSDDGNCSESMQTAGNHREVRFAQLVPDTNYVYSVGTYTDATMRFRTAPNDGDQPADGNVHIWILGDSGTATEKYGGVYTHPGEAREVMDGFTHYNKLNGHNEPLDLILMLGDNAYTDGTDEQWQGAVFDLYTELLSQAATWPTIGNHEMGVGAVPTGDDKVTYYPGASTSASPDSFITRDTKVASRIPYLDIFSLPTRAESGGVPSGTEQYYSFNYGNVHIVSLDTQLTARDEQQRAAMKQWLISDLDSNTLDWTVVIFHHPPYTKASHDSDTAPSSVLGIDQPIIDIRVEFTPVFEDYGVDLVYSGHSHSYERSYYLHGHRGDAATFDPLQHAELNDQGQPSVGYGEQRYPQISANTQQDDKVVYTVAGSSGKMKLGKGKLDHPAHIVQPLDPEGRHGLAELGSVVLDVGSDTLTARFINEKGEVRDTVVIVR